MTPKERAAEWRKRWTSEKFDSLFADIMERSVEKVAADAEADLIASINGCRTGGPVATELAERRVGVERPELPDRADRSH